MRISIYQINGKRDKKRVMFRDSDEFLKQQGSSGINSQIYDKVYEGDVPCNSLEDVYRMFNIGRPADYKGRALSVSDVVEVFDECSKSNFYFCDSIGFKKVEFDVKAAFDSLHPSPVITEKVKSPFICSCGNSHFFAVQNLSVEIVVDAAGNLKKYMDSGIESAIISASKPFGPYTCTACGKEFKKLEKED